MNRVLPIDLSAAHIIAFPNGVWERAGSREEFGNEQDKNLGTSRARVGERAGEEFGT